MNIKELELLPSRLNNKQYHNNKSDWGYTSPKYHGENIFILINRILQNNIGKSWSMTYHYICKKIPKNLKHYIYSSLPTHQSRPYSVYENYYIEDDVIKYKEWKNPHKKKPSVVIKSEIKYFYEPYGYWGENKIEVFKNNNSSYFKFYYIDYNNHRHTISDYDVREIHTPIEEYFKGSKEYKRLKSEEIKKKNLKYKKIQKLRKEKAYSFITKSEIELKKQKEIDKWKIIKHGFDENSFRTNPSLQ